MRDSFFLPNFTWKSYKIIMVFSRRLLCARILKMCPSKNLYALRGRKKKKAFCDVATLCCGVKVAMANVFLMSCDFFMSLVVHFFCWEVAHLALENQYGSSSLGIKSCSWILSVFEWSWILSLEGKCKVLKRLEILSH